MKMFLEDLSDLQKRITITISCDCVNKAIDKEFQMLSKTMHIPGFRVGKVPISFLKKTYGASVCQDAMMNLMEQNFVDVISKNKMKLVRSPEYNIIQLCDGIHQKFIYSVVVEIYPQIQLKGLDNIVIIKPTVNVTENDINLILNAVKKKYIFWENSNTKKISIGDRVTFSIAIQVDNTNIISNRRYYDVENVVMIIGDGSSDLVICDLEKDMIGRSVGDRFNIYIDLSNNHCIPCDIDKIISLIITIKKIETAEFSVLHQDYFKYYNRSKVQENIELNLNKIIKQNVKNQIINSILCTNDFDIPVTLIQNELNILKSKMKNTVYYINNNEFSLSSLYSLIFEESDLEYKARRKVKILLLLHEIIRFYKISVDYKSISQFIETELDKLCSSKKIIRSLKNDSSTKNYVKSMLLEELVMDFLKKRATITEKAVELNKLINNVNMIQLND